MKNWHIQIIRCFTNYHHFLVHCLVDDVIPTYIKLVCHHPIIWANDKLGWHPLFLHLKLSGKFLMKCNLLLFLLVGTHYDLLCTHLLLIFLNWRRRYYLIQLEEVLASLMLEKVFPFQEYGMEVTKHWYSILYGQLFSNLFSLVLISFVFDLNICFFFWLVDVLLVFHFHFCCVHGVVCASITKLINIYDI